MRNCYHLTYLLLLVCVKRILVIAIGFAKSMLNSSKIIVPSLFDHFSHCHCLRCCHSSVVSCCFPCQRWEPMVHSDLI